MNNQNNNRRIKTSDSVSEILRQAEPRAPAPADVREQAYAKLHDHWQANLKRSHRPQKYAVWGLAATVLLAVGAAFFISGGPPAFQTAPIASIVRAKGNNLNISETSSAQMQVLQQTSIISVGNVIATGDDSSLAIDWGQGGSLRVAPKSQIEIINNDQIRLMSGAVYFDSKPLGDLTKTSEKFSIQTPNGVVQHIGTQFITQLDNLTLNVSVREGLVEIKGDNSSWRTTAGHALKLSENGAAEERVNPSYGPEWQWVQQIGPVYNSEGKSAHSLLQWIGRETGYKIEFANAIVRQSAESVRLTGLSPLGPEQALQALPFATDLSYERKDGIILVEAKKR